MTLTIKHASLTGAAANPDVLVDGPKWDANHTVTGTVDAAQMPALTGDVTTSAGAVATTLAANAVTNAKLAVMAPYTIKMNVTGSSGVPTDATIASLTTKTTPTGSDYVMISDQAASGALKKAAFPTGGAPSAPQGRLTITSGMTVLTTAQSARTTVYYTPYIGNQIPIYDGSSMAMMSFSEISVATTDTTKNPAAIGASKVNDWFVWNDAGTLRLSHGPDWTNDTTRSAGTAISQLNGIWLNSVSITNGPASARGTYVGTTRSNASSQFDWLVGGAASGGSPGFLSVWNAYNRVSASAASIDNGAAYTYSSSTVRQARASAGNQVSVVFGLAEDATQISYAGRVSLVASGAAALFGIGVDSTSAFIGQGVLAGGQTTTGVGATAVYSAAPLLGFHIFSANEQDDGTNANNFNVAGQNAFSVIARM